MQIAGLARADDDIVVRPGRSTVLRYRGDRLVAAECINNLAEFLLLRKALGADVPLSRESAADTSMPLKKHLTVL